MLGGGWDLTGPDPCPSALAILFLVPWDEANRQHQWKVTLDDADGNPVVFPSPDGGSVSIHFGGQFEVGRPPGIAAGSTLHQPVAVTIGPLPLEPGRRYVWRLTVNDHSSEDWLVPFSVRPAQVMAN
jgi:hypothetical protein